jgi:uncharacterized protein YjeT (DUF2065 family)
MTVRDDFLDLCDKKKFLSMWVLFSIVVVPVTHGMTSHGVCYMLLPLKWKKLYKHILGLSLTLPHTPFTTEWQGRISKNLLEAQVTVN